MRRLAVIVALLLTAALPSALYAVQPDEVMRNPAQEARARTLSRELRCMVCQNQSIEDSDVDSGNGLQPIGDGTAVPQRMGRQPLQRAGRKVNRRSLW